jgi:hypothetical protein
LISLAEEEGWDAMICFIMEACKGGLYRLLEQGLLGAAEKFLLAVIAAQILHGRQGQYSKVFSLSWLFCTIRVEKLRPAMGRGIDSRNRV